jgi:urease accessory protein UreH
MLKHNALEHEVQSAIIEYLEFQKIPFTRSDATQSFTESGNQVVRVATGWPDITAILPPGGRTLAIECKRAIGGVLSYEQAETLDRIHRVGGLVVIARSVDDVIATMVHGVRQADLGEIAVALAKGPDIKGMTLRRERNARRKVQRRAKVWRS